MKSFLSRFKRISIFLMIASLFLVGCSGPIDNNPIDEPPIDEPELPIEVPIIRHAFNGQIIDSEQEYQAIAIMMSNSKEARPHSGINLADIVYEVTVDGWSITRFMAVFAEDLPTKVGPVRSARLPFAELLKELKLPFAHFGSATTGLGDALTVLKSINLPIRFDGHRGLNDEFYSRDSNRSAPHNAYFNASKALAKIPTFDYEPRFLFDEETSVNDSTVNSLEIKYSTYNTVNYTYDISSKKYLRSINGDVMRDTYTDSQVSVTNIIILHAPHRDVEAVRYVIVDFVGEGKAEFFANGHYEVGKWTKSSATSLTQYFDSEGNEIILLPGNTWIQVVHPNVTIAKEGVN